MQTHELVAHPALPADAVTGVRASISHSDPDWLQLRWRIENAGQLVAPSPAGSRRADGLRQTTCFEVFLRPGGGDAYQEFNFSPSEHWNAYGFQIYREGMAELAISRGPICTFRPGSRFAIFDVAVPRAILPAQPCAMGISAVIEELGGTKSYWALAHPPTDAPDFHAPACFAARLEAPPRS